jgi:hypothetical protein
VFLTVNAARYLRATPRALPALFGQREARGAGFALDEIFHFSDTISEVAIDSAI